MKFFVRRSSQNYDSQGKMMLAYRSLFFDYSYRRDVKCSRKGDKGHS